MFTTLTLFVTLTAATYFVIARARITRPLWSRYPSWLAYWTDCAACSGTAWGLLWAALADFYTIPILTLSSATWLHYVLGAAVGMIWTPLLAYVHTYTWSALMPTDDNAV